MSLDSILIKKRHSRTVSSTIDGLKYVRNLLSDLIFHKLRKTFDSGLAQNIVPTAVVKELPEHSLSESTNKVYECRSCLAPDI